MNMERADAKTDAAKRRWNDWRWQLQHRIRSLDDPFFTSRNFQPTAAICAASEPFPLAITPYYAALIARCDDADPIFRMCVPSAGELFQPAFLKNDPLQEDSHMPVPGLIHRYPDRALLLATAACGTHCRHCNRKRLTGQTESPMTRAHLLRAVNYLCAHPDIRDVIISGGDPFTMRTETLENVIQAVRSVKSVDVIRIGTRTPVVLPMRMTDDLLDMLRRYHPIYVNTHFNHPVELTPQAEEACSRLADAGIPIGNQTVLLRGVNDEADTLMRLFRGLLRIRVKPYYLFQCDLVRGVEHFRTPLRRGIDIMAALRGNLSGLAMPTFVVDAPEGGGKIPLLPDAVVHRDENRTWLRNSSGKVVAYPEP